MKTILVIICLFLFLQVPHPAKATFTENANSVANTHSATINESQLLRQLQAFALLSRKEYEQLTGQHLSLAGRIVYQLQRRRLQSELKKAEESGTAPSALLNRSLAPVEKKSSNTGRTIAIVLLTILLLFLLFLLILLGKWKG